MRRPALMLVVLAALVGTLIVVPGAVYASHQFTDVPDSNVFHEGIAWMKDNRVTVGCNPPAYTKYCPNDSVTRGQVAVFFARYFGPPVLSPSGDYFDDDTGAFYENAANWLFEQGISVGCNPPANNRFCGEDEVTRAQMATFFVRAFDRPFFGFPQTAPDYFIDDTGSVHEDNINRLREGGVTVGCNPPINNRYCPNDPVTRGQMAAFFMRAGETFQPV